MRIVMTLNETEIKNAIAEYIVKRGYTIDENSITLGYELDNELEPSFYSQLDVKTQHTT